MARSMFRTSKPGLCLAAILLFTTLSPAGEQLQEDHQPTSIKDNAALWYWDAFSQMQGMDFDELYQDWPPKINADKVRSTLVDSQYNTLTFLHRGASQPACVWGVDFKLDGLNALLPHLGLARRLAKIAAVRAEYYFQQGDIDLAVDDLIAAMVLGRHISADGSLIDALVQMSISQHTQQVLVKNLYRLDRTQLIRLKQKLADLPPRQTMAQAIAMEKHLADWFVKRVREDGIESLRDNFDEDVLSQEGFKKLVKQSGGTAEGFERLAEQMRGYYDQTQHIMTIGYDEVDPAEEALFKQIVLDDNALALGFLPACGEARRKELRHEARTAMLYAMIALQIDGSEALHQISDPYDGQPFEIEVTDTAVVLRSRMPDKEGNPISVEFPGIKVQLTSDQP
jgi:hypothetical protein